jgi:hypothetical protein
MTFILHNPPPVIPLCLIHGKWMCRHKKLFSFPLCLELFSSQHTHMAIQKFIFTSVNYDWRVHRRAHMLHLIPHFEMKWGKLWNIQNRNDKITVWSWDCTLTDTARWNGNETKHTCACTQHLHNIYHSSQYLKTHNIHKQFFSCVQ